MQDEEKMVREEFVYALKEQVVQALGAGYQVEGLWVRKNNGVKKETLIVREENRECAPSFYLDELYDSYRNGYPIEALTEHIVETVNGEYMGGIRCIDDVLSKEWFEERLFLRLVHMEKNKEELEDAVYVKVQDLAAVFYVLTERGPDSIKSFRLPKNAWVRADLGEAKEYYPKILANTERLFPAEIMRIEERLIRCMEREGEEIPEWLEREFELVRNGEKGPLFYVLTNTSKINGAAVMLYEGMLKKFEERFESGFYIIPSSVHEVLILVEADESVEELNRMVREVNDSQVAPEEVLSDHVYYYSTSGGFCSMET